MPLLDRERGWGGDAERGKVGSGRVALADVPPTSGMESSVLLLTQEHVRSIVHVCLQSPAASLGTASWHSIVQTYPISRNYGLITLCAFKPSPPDENVGCFQGWNAYTPIFSQVWQLV